MLAQESAVFGTSCFRLEQGRAPDLSLVFGQKNVTSSSRGRRTLSVSPASAPSLCPQNPYRTSSSANTHNHTASVGDGQSGTRSRPPSISRERPHRQCGPIGSGWHPCSSSACGGHGSACVSRRPRLTPPWHVGGVPGGCVIWQLAGGVDGMLACRRHG
jgi:hypothetical protein